LFVQIDDFHYHIYFDVLDIVCFPLNSFGERTQDNNSFWISSQNKKLLCKKLYHQQLSTIEIQEFCTQIGQEILKRIKEKSQE
jgi:hypothetical protein